MDPTCTVLYHNKYMKIPIHQHSESVNLFNISKDGAAHIYLDGILYFVVLFNISKDGAAHIYLDGILYFVVLFDISKDVAAHIYLDGILYFVVVFNISKDGATHIYLDGILYFVVVFNISKDGAAHIYLDGILYFVVVFNISKDGAAHIYLDGILYFVVLFNISKDGAAHIYLDGILLYCSIYQKMAQHIYIWMVFCCTVRYIKRWRSTYIFGWYFVVVFNISKDGAAHIYLDGILYFVVVFNISKDGAAHIYLDGILYFVVLFNISKDGAAHIYLDGILLYCSIYQKMAQHIYIWMVFCCTVRYIKRWRSTYIFGWYFVVAFNISKDGAAHIYLDGILLYCSIYQKMAQHIYIWMVFCCSVQYIKRWRSTYIFGWYFVFC